MSEKVTQEEINYLKRLLWTYEDDKESPMYNITKIVLKLTGSGVGKTY